MILAIAICPQPIFLGIIDVVRHSLVDFYLFNLQS